MKRRRLTRIAILLGSLLFSVAAAELCVRALALAPGFADVSFGSHRTSADPELLWELDPGSPGVNSVGLRGRELAQPKAKRRLLVLGDSIGFGLDLADDETIPARLQTELDAAGASVEVLNGGVAGYNSLQEARWLETKGPGLEPDEILVLFCTNDIHPLDALPEGELRYATQNSAQDALGLVHSARRYGPVVRWVLTHVHLSRFALARTPVPHDRRANEPHELHEVRAAFERMRAFCAARGLPITIAIVPRFAKLADYEFEWIHVEAARLATSCGFRVEDLLPAVRKQTLKARRTLSLPRDPLHPNAAGAELIASELARSLAL